MLSDEPKHCNGVPPSLYVRWVERSTGFAGACDLARLGKPATDQWNQSALLL
jgi:hypothetical protein